MTLTSSHNKQQTIDTASGAGDMRYIYLISCCTLLYYYFCQDVCVYKALNVWFPTQPFPWGGSYEFIQTCVFEGFVVTFIVVCNFYCLPAFIVIILGGDLNHIFKFISFPWYVIMN